MTAADSVDLAVDGHGRRLALGAAFIGTCPLPRTTASAAMHTRRTATTYTLALLCAAAPPPARAANVTYSVWSDKVGAEAQGCAASDDGFSDPVNVPVGACVPTEPLGRGVASFDNYPYAIIGCSSATVTVTYYARSDCMDVGVLPCVAALNQLAHPDSDTVNVTGRTVDTRGLTSTQAVGMCVEGKQHP